MVWPTLGSRTAKEQEQHVTLRSLVCRSNIGQSPAANRSPAFTRADIVSHMDLEMALSWQQREVGTWTVYKEGQSAKWCHVQEDCTGLQCFLEPVLNERCEGCDLVTGAAEIAETSLIDTEKVFHGWGDSLQGGAFQQLVTYTQE